MIEASNDIDEIVCVVSSNGEVLSWHIHLLRTEQHLAFVIDHEAAVRCQGRVPLKTADEEELVVGDVYRLEVVRNIVSCIVLIILECQLLELTSLFDGGHKIRRVSGATHRQDQISRTSPLLNLLGKNRFETDVIP